MKFFNLNFLGMIHGDFNETNILVDDSENQVCGILDFGMIFLFFASSYLLVNYRDHRVTFLTKNIT